MLCDPITTATTTTTTVAMADVDDDTDRVFNAGGIQYVDCSQQVAPVRHPQQSPAATHNITVS